MNDNNNELPPNEMENVEPQPTKKCPYKRWLPILACILSLIAIGIALVTGMCLSKVKQQVKSDHVILEKAVQRIQQQLPELQGAVKTQQGNITELLNQTKASRMHWAYSEAFYLVQQAVYQIRLDNINGSIGLLNDTLNIFEMISLPHSTQIENKLDAVIKILKATPKIDRNNVISQLDQLAKQVDQLPLNLPKTSGSSKPDVNATKETSSGFKGFFKEGWDQIKQLVIIRYHEKPIEPLITPLQDVYLRQNLQLQLEQASMAVLYRDPKLYHSSLEKVNAWVKQFFNLRSASTQAFLKTTNNLLQINVAPATPNVMTTLQEVLEEIKMSLKASEVSQ